MIVINKYSEGQKIGIPVVIRKKNTEILVYNQNKITCEYVHAYLHVHYAHIVFDRKKQKVISYIYNVQHINLKLENSGI